MKIRTGRLILLVLISFSLVCNDLLASSFLARPGYGDTTGHEFDQLNPDGILKKKKKPTVVAPPPVVETPGKDASAAPRRRVVVIQPPVEKPVSASATRKISSSSKPAATPAITKARQGVPILAPIIIEPPPVKTVAIKPTGPAPQIVAAPAIISPPALKQAKPAGLSVPPPRQTRPPGTVDPPEQLTVVAKKTQAPSQKATGPVVVLAPLPVKTVEPLAVQVTPSSSEAQIARQSAKAVVPARPAPVSAHAPIAKPDLEPMAQPQKAVRPATGKAPAVIQAPAEIPASHYPAEDTRVTIHEKRPGRPGRKPEGTVTIAEGNQPLPKPVMTSPAAAPRPVSVIPPTPETSAKPAPARETGKAAPAHDSQTRAIRPADAVAPAQAPAKAITAPERPSAATTVADSSKTVSEESSARAAKEKPAAEKPSGSSETVIAGEDSVDESIDDASMGMEVTTAASGAGSAIYGVSSFDSGLRVEATTDLQSITVEPGRSFTLSFRTTNISGKPGNFIEEFDMPPGFELTFPPAEFSLEPMESYNSIVMVSAPAYLPAGEHQFTYRVLDPKNQSVHGSLSFRFSINATVDLKFIVEEKPNSVLDGENFTVKGKLYNNSNATFSVGLSLTQQEHFKVNITPDRATLAPGSFVDIIINGRTGGIQGGSRNVSFMLNAFDNSRRDRKVLMRQNIGIKFYTRASRRIDFRKRLPVTATMYINGDKNGSAYQYEIQGRGVLDSKGRRKIDFLVREKAPENNKLSSMYREEARLGYSGETFGVRLGDHNFGVSALSKYYKGKGVALDVFTGQKTSVGAISYKRTWTTTPLTGEGFYVSHRLSDRTLLRFNHLSTVSDRFAESPDERFSTLSFTHHHLKNAVLKGEIARKWGGELTDKRNSAYLIDYSATVKKVATFNVSHSDTGVIYAGEMVGSENTNSSLNVYLGQNTSMNAYYQLSKQNPLIKDKTVNAVKQSNFQSGLEHQLSRSRSFSMAYFNIDSSDWLNESFANNEHGIMARIAQNNIKSGMNYSIYRKKATDLQLGNNQWNTVHRLNSYIKRDRIALNFYAGLTRFSSNYYQITGDNNNYGFALNWHILESLKMKFNYNHLDNSGNIPNRAFWNMNMNYRFRDTTLDLNLKQQRTNSAQQDLIYYELAMSQKFGVPVSHNIKLGALAGTLSEDIGSGTQPVVNATLLLGNFAAVTDKKGKFVFADLKPGTYTLDIVSKTSRSFVSSISLPASVNIRGGRLAMIDLKMEPACSLSGAIKVENDAISEISEKSRSLGDLMLAPMPQGFKPLDPEMLYGIIIVFEKDGERLTSRTNNMGHFSAGNLKPGKWKYQIIKTSLPNGYEISPVKGEIDLTPDSEATFDFVVTPVIRKIEFVSE